MDLHTPRSPRPSDGYMYNETWISEMGLTGSFGGQVVALPDFLAENPWRHLRESSVFPVRTADGIVHGVVLDSVSPLVVRYPDTTLRSPSNAGWTRKLSCTPRFSPLLFGGR